MQWWFWWSLDVLQWRFQRNKIFTWYCFIWYNNLWKCEETKHHYYIIIHFHKSILQKICFFFREILVFTQMYNITSHGYYHIWNLKFEFKSRINARKFIQLSNQQSWPIILKADDQALYYLGNGNPLLKKLLLHSYAIIQKTHFKCASLNWHVSVT